MQIGIHVNIMLGGAVLLAALPARGDMSEPAAAWPLLLESGPAPVGPGGGSPEIFGFGGDPRGTPACGFSGHALADEMSQLAPGGKVPLRQAFAERAARELPASPGSAALFLSAIVSVGAWHLVRSARQVNLGYVPDWYHTGGPAQIARAVPLDLKFGPAPLCPFAQLVLGAPDFHRGPPTSRAPLKAQYLPRTSPIRGPPVRPAP